MIAPVNGTTTRSRFAARSRYSNCPDHCTEMPGPSLTFASTARLHPHHRGKVAPADIHVDPPREARVLAFQRSGPSAITMRATAPSESAPTSVIIGRSRSLSRESRSSRG